MTIEDFRRAREQAAERHEQPSATPTSAIHRPRTAKEKVVIAGAWTMMVGGLALAAIAGVALVFIVIVVAFSLAVTAAHVALTTTIGAVAVLAILFYFGTKKN